MTQNLRSLRRQRERGRRRVAVITASGAVGATALASALGMAFAEQQTANAASVVPSALTSAEAADPAQPTVVRPAQVVVLPMPAAAEPTRPETGAPRRRRAEVVRQVSGTSATGVGFAPPADAPRDVSAIDKDSSNSSDDSDRHAKHSKSHASSGGS